MADAGVGRKGPVSLDSLSKEELTAKCKQLLQLAQKAKQAKDDLAKKFEELAAEGRIEAEKQKTRKDKDEEKIKNLESKNEELIAGQDQVQDLLEAKQRQIDRISKENESLLQQIDAYSEEARVAGQSRAKVETDLKEMKSKMADLEKKAGKAMESEAALICAKETEKKQKDKFLMMEKDLKKKEELINTQKEKIADMDQKLKVQEKKAADLVKLDLEKTAKIKELNAHLDSLKTKCNEDHDVLLKETEVNQLKDKIEVLEKYKKNNEDLQTKMQDETSCLKKELKELELGKVKILKELEEATSRYQFLQTEKKVVESTNEGLISELNQLNEEVKKRGEKIGRLEQNIQEQQKQQEIKKQEELKLQEQQDKERSEKEEEKQQEKEYELLEQLSTVKSTLKRTYEDLDEARNEKDRLYDLKSNLEKKIGELEEESKDQGLMIESQNKEISSLDFELSECRDRMSKTEINLTELRLKLLKESEKVVLNVALVETLREEISKGNIEIKTLNESLNQIKQEKDEIQKVLELSKEELAKATENLEKNSKEINDLNDKNEENEKNKALEEDISRKEETIKVLKADLDDKEGQISDLRKEKENLEIKMNSCIGELENKKQDLVIELEEFKKNKMEGSKSEETLQDASRKQDQFLVENTKHAELHKNCIDEGKVLEKDLNARLTEIAELTTERDNLAQDIQNVKIENESLKSVHENIAEKLRTELKEMETKLKTALQESESAKANSNDLSKQAQIQSNKCQELEQALSEMKTNLTLKLEELANATSFKDNLEIELKTKTENLVSLSQVSQDLQMELEKKTKDLDSKCQELLKKKQELESSNKKCSDLSRELDSVRIQVGNSMNSSAQELDESRSEIMSTSTVSRVEEFSRMKDVEDSFEDRYSKLKLVAIKLKKKVNEQTKIIEELERMKSKPKPESEPTGMKDKIATLTKNFTQLQSEYDQAVDKIDYLEKKVKDLTKDLETMMTESMTNKQNAMEASQNLLSAKSEITKYSGLMREKEVELTSLRVTLDQEQKERKCVEQKVKETGFLENQLKEKSNQIFLMEETLSTLKLQIGQLEETLVQEQERSERGQSSLSSTRAQLHEVEVELVKKRGEAEELSKKFEETMRLYEDTRNQLATVLARNDKIEGQERSKVGQLERQAQSLELRLQNKTAECKSQEDELEKVKTEFEKYKVRAQSVLKQAKEKGEQEDVRRNQDEMKTMEKINTGLEERMRSLMVELKTVQMEKGGLQEEHDRLMERQSLLLQEIAGKEKTWRSKVEEMEKKQKMVELDLEKGAEKVSHQMEDIKQKYMQDLEIARASYSTEIGRFKTQIDVAENEIVRLEFVLQKEQEARRYAEEAAGAQPPMERLDISQIEREAAEGQEVEPPVGRGGGGSIQSPLPLDQLLAQGDGAGFQERETVRSAASSRQGGDRAPGVDRQIAHLSALLAESEAQNGRLEKLTEVLKEEIRTYQRSEERHKHIENLEYVKNVILKFLTLGGEERSRLVPVLSTILKLSKKEIDLIQQVVKAEEDSSGGGGGGEGWGSYLHLWSSP